MGEAAPRSVRLQGAIDHLVNVVMELREVERGEDTGKLLGDLVRENREAWGLSLQQLVDKIGCSKAHLWVIEQGTSNNPSADLIGKLASALTLPPIQVLNAALMSQRIEAKGESHAAD